jgi:hypothetical protein
MFKTVIKDVLLLFVGAGLGIGTMDTIRPTQTDTAANQKAVAPTLADGRLVAYYFHGSHRCDTCKTIEAFSHEALKPSIEQGKVDWLTINYDLPANKHFRKDFDIIAPSLVLVRGDGTSPSRWKNLDEVWSLTDDQPSFVAYVQRELASFEGTGQ